jgi:hypothetical protein
MSRRVMAAPLLSLAAIGPAFAQCAPRWSAYSGPALDGPVYGLTVWDPDGAGPAGSMVVAGGNFQHAGAQSLNFVGGWDGSGWRPLANGVSGTVECVTLYDPDGPGPALPQPVAGGIFTLAGQTPVNGVARFDGEQWQPIGSGVWSPGGFHATVYCAAPWNSSLVIGGSFDFAGGVATPGVARWDQAAWAAFTPDLMEFSSLYSDAGVLYAGGNFSRPGNPIGVLRWNGQTWEVPGENYPSEQVWGLTTYRGQVVAGGLAFGNEFSGVAAFDGASWHSLGSGVDFVVYALCVFDPDGPGPMPEALIAGGAFTTAGGQPASGIAMWDGVSWSPLGSGTDGAVRALGVWNQTLVVGGLFGAAGGITSPGLAFWGCPQPAACYANCDQSTTPPILNVADFICFMTEFAAADPAANCDASTQPPTLNVADFVCFTQRFAAGCP